MALSVSNLTTFNQDGLADNDWVTSSVTPTGNALVLVTVTVATNGGYDPLPDSVTGNGITYALVDSNVWDGTSGSRRVTLLYRGMAASPSSGTITVAWGSQTSLRGSMVVDEITGVTTGNNGADAIVQSVDGNNGDSGSSLSLTLGAFGSANNGTYGVFGEWNTLTPTAGSGFTIIGGIVGTNETSVSEWKASNDTTVDISYNSATNIGGVAIEVEQAAVAATRRVFNVT